MNTFTFNGINSGTFGLYIGGQNTFNSPQRDITKVAIPGRNGDLIKDNGRFLNSQIAYNIVIMNNFAENAMAVRNWLLSPKGYVRLEDTYHPDHYRLARVAETIEFETGAYNNTGKASVVFDCMPQKFLKTGEIAISVASGDVITNPTLFDSKPLIEVELSGDCEGDLTIGNQIISIDGPAYIAIDSETMNCYDENTNLNSYVQLGTNGFPLLKPGNTGIAFSGDISSVSITPRWWEL